MVKFFLPLRMWLMHTFPHVYIRLSQWVSRYMFPETVRLLKGKSHTKVDRPSAIYFGYYRCGTRFIHRCLSDLCQSEGRPIIDIETYIARVGTIPESQLNAPSFYREHFKPRGCYFGPHYRFRPIPLLDSYRILLVLRDPRDVLTSRYYSETYAHTLMNKAGLAHRRKLQAMTIDEFAKEYAPEVGEAYQTYLDELSAKPNAFVSSYEDMIANFPQWLRKVVVHLELEPQENILEALLAQNHFSVSKENVYAHKRSVKPGSHLQKLAPETIDYLNKHFTPILDVMGYEKSPPLD